MMKTGYISSIMFIILILAMAVVACQVGGQTAEPPQTSPPPVSAQASPTPAEAELALPTEPPAEAAPTSLPPTEAPPPTEPPPAPTEAPPAAPAGQAPSGCAEEVCRLEGVFPLGRPVSQGGRIEYDPSYRFGEYHRSKRGANLGAGFLNSTGTSVVAAADGRVVVAGDDSVKSYASRPNTYGNLVILEHSLAGVSEPVYTLYAHLSEVLVKEGDGVSAGQEIGKVGMSGNIAGSMLHFEVRLGENKPEAAVNPELWLAPLSGADGQVLGALAGRLVDANGDFIEVNNVVLELLGGPGQPAVEQYYISTYMDKDLTGSNPWQENFAIGDLPPGEYQISVWLGQQMHQTLVEVEPGKLTVVTLQVK